MAARETWGQYEDRVERTIEAGEIAYATAVLRGGDDTMAPGRIDPSRCDACNEMLRPGVTFHILGNGAMFCQPCMDYDPGANDADLALEQYLESSYYAQVEHYPESSYYFDYGDERDY